MAAFNLNIIYRFYSDQLVKKTCDLDFAGQFINVVGANDLEIPIVGVLSVPITICGHTIDACLLVKQESESSHNNRRQQFPVLLGCNILRKELDVLSVGTQGLPSDWQFVSHVLGIGDKSVNEELKMKDATTSVVSAQSWQFLPSNSVRIMNCHLVSAGGPAKVVSKQVVIDEPAPEQVPFVIPGLTEVVENPLGTGEVMVQVVVCNPERRLIPLPPFTKLATGLPVSCEGAAVVTAEDEIIKATISEVAYMGNIEKQESLVNHDQKQAVGTQDSEACVESEIKLPDGTGVELPKGFKLGSVSSEFRPSVARLLEEHRLAFSQGPLDLGKCDIIPHQIRLTDERPVNLPFRRVPPHLVQEVREQLQGLLAKGIIRKSSSPYASPVVPVRKKDGSLRFWVDYRQLNHKTQKDAFPLPRIEESLEVLGEATIFSSLDLSHGYFQVVMDTDSIPLTAFRVPWGLFEFLRLPQGLCGSPGTFQRVMEYLFGDLNGRSVLLYLDDILVFSSDIPEHIERLHEVFRRLEGAGLKLNGKKCCLFQTELKYLGHIVSSSGVSVDPDKVNRVRCWPTPENQESLASFLGLASYYRRFIRGFSGLAAPLHELRCTAGSRTARLEWNTKAEAAFVNLKKALTEAPVLAYPRFDRGFTLEVDASFQGLGACLSQLGDDGQLHPVAFASRGLRGSERNYPDYSSFKLELLGLKWAIVDKFGDLIMGHHCDVLTDNNPLAHLRTANLGATEQRWVAKLAPYDLTIHYRSGKLNRVADALSRHPLNEVNVSSVSIIQEVTTATPVPLEVQELGTVNVDLNDGSSGGQAAGVLPSYTKEQLANLHQNDVLIGKIWQRKLDGWQPGEDAAECNIPGFSGWLREYDRYVFKKGLLYLSWNDPNQADHTTYRLLVPKQLQPVLLEAAHDKWGHQGVARTLALLRPRCYWPGMSGHVKSHVRR